MDFISENFIKNFSALYSPLERHLVDEPWVRVPGQRVITEVTTNTFRHTVVLSEKVPLVTQRASLFSICYLFKKLEIISK